MKVNNDYFQLPDKHESTLRKIKAVLEESGI